MTTSGPLKRAIQEEDWKKAAELLKEWRRENPGDAPGWYWSAVCFQREGRFGDALEAAHRALELNPGHDATRNLIYELENAPETLLESSAHFEPETSVSAVPLTEADSGEEAPPPTQVTTDTARPSRVMTQWKEGETVEGRYEVRQVIRGGMGEVAFVFDRELGLELAVKTPLPKVLASASGRTRFIREAESWIALGLHPNICTAFYLRELAGYPRLFIEYVDGGSLRTWLKFAKKRGQAEKLDIAIQIASGMEHAHSFLWKDASGVEHQGIVHRDLKPANILLGSDGLARVTDFGLVGRSSETEIAEENAGEKENAGESSLTLPGAWGTVTMGGSVMGTPPYMPPEQWRGAHFAQASADIYAFGAILFEILCGLRPFALSVEEKKGRPELQLTRWKEMHLSSAPRNPLSLNPQLDQELAALMLQCLEKEAHQRPESFKAIGEQLREIYARLCREKYPRPRPRASRLLADSLNNRGVSYQSLRREFQAENAWKEALRINPHHREAIYNLTLFRWVRGASADETSASLGSLPDIDRSRSTDWRGGVLVARLLLLLGTWDRALEILQYCLEASGNNSRVALDYALGLCAKAIRIEQKTPRENARSTGGSARSTEGITGESVSEALWREAVSVLGRCGGALRHDPRLLVAYALSQEKLGEAEAAQRLMAAALRRQPDLPKDIRGAAARLMPGQIPRNPLEIPGARVVRLEISMDNTLGLGLLYDNRIVIWDLDSGRIRNIFKLSGPRPRSMTLDMMREAVWIATEVEAVTALSMDNGRVLSRLTPHSGFLNDLAISADGRKLLGAGTSRQLYVWDLEDRSLTKSIPTDIGYLTQTTIAADCRTALVGGSSGSALLIDLETGATIRRLSTGGGLVSSLDISHGARYAALGSEEGRISLWNLKSPGLPRSFRGQSAAISFLALNDQSSHLISGSKDGSLRLWDLTTDRSLACISFEEPIQAGAAFPDFSHVVVAAGVREIQRIDLKEKPSWLPNWAIASPISVSEMETKSRSFRRHLTVARRELEEENFDGVLSALESARSIPGFEKMPELLEFSEKLNRRLPRESLRSTWEEDRLEEHDVPIHSVAVSSDGKTVLSAGGDRKLRLHRQGTELELSTEEGWAERTVTISPSGDQALSGGLENEVHLWDLLNNSLIQSFPGHEGQIHALDYRFDGAFFLSASADQTLRYWDTETGVCLKILEGHSGEVFGGTVHPSGDLAASCGEDGILIWDLRQGFAVSSLSGHSGAVRAVVWTGDGRRLLSGGIDGNLILWNPRTGGIIQRLESGHAIECLSLIGDDHFVCTGDSDGNVQLWDLRIRRRLAIHSKHQSRVLSVAVPASGQRCYSASSDGTVRAWYFDWKPDPRPQPLSKARAHLEVFLQQKKQIRRRAVWDAEDIGDLLEKLQRLGFERLPPEEIDAELRRIAQESEKSNLRDELELSGQTRIIRSPAEKEKHRSTRKTLLWGAGLLLTLVMVVLSTLTPSGPAYDIAERLQLRKQKQMEIGAVAAAAKSVGRCSPTEKGNYLKTLAQGKNFLDLVHSAGCLSRLEEDQIAESFFGIINSSQDKSLNQDQIQIMTAFLALAPPSICGKLASSLDDRSGTIRSLAAEALALHKEESCRKLFLDAALRRDPLSRLASAEHFNTLIATSNIPASETFPFVENFYASAWPEIRREAADLLGLFKGSDGEALAEKMLEDKDPQVRRLAGTYLSNQH